MKLLAVLTAFAAGLPVAATAQRVEAGLVDSVAGAAPGLRVQRAGRWEPLARLQPLYVNDSVAADAGVRTRLHLYGHGARWLCGAPGRPGCAAGLRVGAPGRRGGLGAAVLGLVRHALEPLFGGEPWSRKVNTIGRGDDDIVVPLLGLAPVLSAGHRAIDVVWEGGVAPFVVRLVRDGAGPVAELSGRTDRSAALGKIPLAPGAYGLQIVDARGTVRMTRVRVVASGEVPAPPPEFREAALSGSAKLLLESAWLAGQGDGRWSWEAWVRLGTLGTDETARRLRAELAAGRLPPPSN